MTATMRAASARVFGSVRAGAGLYLAQGAVVRGMSAGVRIGAAVMVLENVVLTDRRDAPLRIGAKVVFGHRALVIGAEIGDLCEIGNGALILPGAVLGDGCILGEGTLIAADARIPERSVVVGRPGRVLRRLTAADEAMIVRMRGGDVSLPLSPPETLIAANLLEGSMGTLYAYRDRTPCVDESAFLFDSAEITGDVVIGADCIIAAGVRIIGDAHGPVRIGHRVQILENTVLHLLPDNELVLADDVVIGPGCMIHGCAIGAGSVIEPGAMICDHSVLGRNTLVKAGSLVKQRAQFPAGAVLEGFPARQIGSLSEPQSLPGWALRLADVRALRRVDRG